MVPVGPKEGESFYRSTDQAAPTGAGRGRELYSFNAGTMSGRAATASLTGGTVPEISPDDAARLGIVDAGRASVRSRYGETVLSCRISERLQPGMRVTTFSDPALPVNNLTGPGRDPETHTPKYKVRPSASNAPSMTRGPTAAREGRRT